MASVEVIGDATLHLGDCMEVLPTLDRVDMVLCDLPYGTTRNKWDSVLPLSALWRHYDRLCKGAVVLTAQTPRELSRWLSTRIDSRKNAREAAASIRAGKDGLK